MAAIHLKKSVEKDGELLLTGLPLKKGEEVEVTIDSKAAKPQGIPASELLKSGLVGLWKDREDIGDSSEFARKLRSRVEKRGT